MPRSTRQQFAARLGKIALVGLLAFLRVVCLSSDAYVRLSWSSALLTDEGFYIHNARNLVLFGTARTDDFNNALIMPLLHVVQVGMFRLVGVGAIQARSISVVLSLLTLWVFFAALRRAFGERVAWLGLVLLGLDPVFVLYNRMALMDTPACLPLCGAFYAWVRAGEGRGRTEFTSQPAYKKPVEKACGQLSYGQKIVSCSSALSVSTQATSSFTGRLAAGLANRHRNLNGICRFPGDRYFWLAACGACLGMAYCIRGLAAIVVPVPLLLIFWAVFSSEGRLAEGHSNRLFISRNLTANLCRYALTYLAGLGVILAAYLLLWYLPHHQELARVNAYYLHHQLLPDTLRHLWQNIQHAFFGDDRGLAPYLFRHTPVTFALCLLWIVTNKGEGYKEKNSAFLLCWLLLNWTMLAVISYAPDRYYILFYPALCGLAALALNDIHALLARLWRSRPKRALLGGFLAYHLAEAFLHHGSRASEICLYGFVAVVLVTLALLPSNMSQWREQQAVKPKFLSAALLCVWTLVALAWTSDWLRHLEYTQREADDWLAAHLPADSVLIGDVAPGLCLNNRFRVVNVIPGLCNDRQPVERFAPSPRYILILDDKFKEPWWRAHYPELVASERQLHKFSRVIRLPVGVYQVSGVRR